MRGTKRGGSFLLCLLINMVLNPEWSIPAWIAWAMHWGLNISIGWFIGGLVAWIVFVWVKTWITGWLIACGNEKDPPKENKNPYSAKNTYGVKRND